MKKGLRKNRLVALNKVSRGKWLFLCDCGKQKIIFNGNFLTEKTKSCGCFHSESIGYRARTHGFYGTKIYRTWRHMLDRCYNKNVKFYSCYGGRGIRVCERWKIFINFLKDMGEPIFKNNSLGRINNELGYSKENCEWQTAKQQARNTRNTKLNEKLVRKIRESKRSGADWGREIGCSKELINMVKRKEIWRDV
jgi:hypothetical protein